MSDKSKKTADKKPSKSHFQISIEKHITVAADSLEEVQKAAEPMRKAFTGFEVVVTPFKTEQANVRVFIDANGQLDKIPAVVASFEALRDLDPEEGVAVVKGEPGKFIFVPQAPPSQAPGSVVVGKNGGAWCEINFMEKLREQAMAARAAMQHPNADRRWLTMGDDPTSEHKFPQGLLSSCEACGMKRMKKRGEFFYAPSVEGPWENFADVCVPLPEPEPEKPWRDKTIIMMDVETTGLDWTTDSVTEIGIVVGKLDSSAPGGLIIIDRMQSLVRPTQMPTREEYAPVEAVTHISYDELHRAPHPGAVASRVFSFIDDSRFDRQDTIAAAYNFDFDHPFLAGSLFARVGGRTPNILRAQAPRLDPYRWVQKRDKYVKSRTNNKNEKIGRHKLTEVAARYGLIEQDAEGAHRADYDAEIALRILAHLAPEVPSDLDDLLNYQRASEDEWAKGFFGVYLPNKLAQERLARRQAAAQE